jgi:hypothetical protein
MYCFCRGFVYSNDSNGSFGERVKSFLTPVSVDSMSRTRRASGVVYGVMVIDMGVHELAGLDDSINLTQVGGSTQGLKGIVYKLLRLGEGIVAVNHCC